MFRFDIVFFNYNHLHCFTNNFVRILNFDKSRDRVICVTASASKKERDEFEKFCSENSIENFRYIPRKNFGLAEKARLDFFSGKVGGAHFDSQYIFQMQEHYMALNDPCSIWDEANGGGIKGDVSPDVNYDLDEIEKIFKKENVSTLYCDRGRPMRFSVAKRWFIAPNGGNFIFKTSMLVPLKQRLIRLRKTCDGTYGWALFMEYYWGELFFEDKLGTYDYLNKLTLFKYPDNDELFKEGSEDYYSLRNGYLSSYFYPGLKRKITLKDIFSEKGKRFLKRVGLDLIGYIKYKIS